MADSIAIHQEGKKNEFHAEELQSVFPHFLWLSRDNHLQNCDDDKKPITATEYLKTKILVTSGETCPTTHDLVVSALTTLYPSINCLQVPSPGCDPLINSEDCSKGFNSGLKNAIDFILSQIEPKMGRNSQPLTGEILATLGEDYAKALNLPTSLLNVEMSWIAAVELQLHKSSDTFVDEYQRLMEEHLHACLPLEEGSFKQAHKMLSPVTADSELSPKVSLTTLQEIHQSTFSTVCQKFQKKINYYLPAISQEDHNSELYLKKKKIMEDFQAKIVKIESNGKITGGLLHTFIKKNEAESERECEKLFDELYGEQLNQDRINLHYLEQNYHLRAKERRLGPAMEKVCEKKLESIPGAVHDLKAKALSESILMLSWNKPKINAQALKQCKVLYSSRTGGWNEKILSSKETKLKIDCLIANTEYTLKVRSYGLIEGECSKSVKTKTNAGKPNKPEKPQIKLTSPEQARLSVPALSEEDENGSQVCKMDVFIGTNDMNDEHLKQTSHTVQHGAKLYSCNILIPDTSRYNNETNLMIYVQLFNKVGGSEKSEAERLPVTDLIPGPPQNLLYENKSTLVKVSWCAGFPNSSAASFYEIEFKNIHGSWETKHNRFCEKDLSYTFLNLKPASEYFIRVGSGNLKNPPGDQSKKTLHIHTLPDRPSVPQPPCINPDPRLGCHKAWLVSPKLSKEEENGSAVHSIVLKQRSNNCGQWKEDRYCIKQNASDIRVEVELLNATCETNIIHFNLIMLNNCGNSDESSPYALEPASMIPGPPENLKCADVSYSSVTLSWEKPLHNPISVDCYCIDAKKGSGNWKSETEVDFHHYSVLISGLSPNTMYDFRAYSKNKDSLRADNQCSHSVQVITKKCKPRKLKHSEISLDIVNYSTGLLTFPKPKFSDCGSEIESVQVIRLNSEKIQIGEYRGYDISLEELKKQSDYFQKHIKLDSDTHFVQLMLVNEIGPSDPSEPIGVAPSSLIPGVPKKFMSLEQEIWSRQIALKWESPNQNERAAKMYTLEMKVEPVVNSGPDFRWTKVEYKHETKGNEHVAIVSNLKPCTEFCFRVYAVNHEVKGQCSEEIKVSTTGTRPDNPPKPHVLCNDLNPNVVDLTVQSLETDQENGAPVTDISVEVSKDLQKWEEIKVKNLANADKQTHHIISVDLPNITQANLSVKNVFYFRVKMRNQFGQSGPSENISLPFNLLRPGKVQELQYSCDVAHSISLSWKPPKAHPALVSNYSVQVKFNSNDGWKEEASIDSRNIDDTLQTLIKVQEMNVKFSIRIFAKNKGLDGPFSEICGETPEIFPGPPQNLRLDKVQPYKVKVRWQQPHKNIEAVHQYEIKVYKDGEIVGDAMYTKRVSKVISNLASYTEYMVRVTALNVKGNSNREHFVEIVVKTNLSDGWRRLANALTIGQAAKRPDPDDDLLSSGDET